MRNGTERFGAWMATSGTVCFGLFDGVYSLVGGIMLIVGLLTFAAGRMKE